MEDVTLAMTLARMRMVIGVGAVAAPGLAARVLGGRDAASGTSPVLVRMLGARDLALGLGTVIALDRGKPVRGWLEGSALSDALDFVACIAGRERMAPGVGVVAGGFGGVAAVVGGLLSRRLDPAPAAHPGQPEAIATGH